MHSLLRTFQNVVELGEEEESRGASAPYQPGDLREQSDPGVLKQHISTLTQKLARQAQSYEELRRESISMEKELTRVRLRFVAARKLWECTNESLERAIQNLVEYELFGAASPPSLKTSTASASSSGKLSPSPASSSLPHATYIASLREQVQQLKEMVMRTIEEQSQLRSEKQYEEAQRVLRANGLLDSLLDAEVRVALQKLVAHWSSERASYESVIERLEVSVSKHAEREALLSDCVKQEQERCAEATAQKSAAESEELRRLRNELAKWQRGERATVENGPVDLPGSCDTVNRTPASATSHTAGGHEQDASPAPHDLTTASHFASQRGTGANDSTGAALKADRAGGSAVGESALNKSSACAATAVPAMRRSTTSIGTTALYKRRCSTLSLACAQVRRSFRGVKNRWSS
ncbi:hypothetical protein LSCM1_01748 [Leishmania martiniquensis]|uniref:Uncharacterized protein n=1 Tax=Leishmania martiniquensis TaxID=1580590 RepID=A0A836GBV1_9TRYP|nr:hypothetical protein LSCM1_01748 [Leishmania martiniquensis]